MTKRFSILQALRFGFYTLIEHFGFFLSLILVYMASMVGFCMIVIPLFILPFSARIMSIINILRVAGVNHTDMARTVINQMGLQFSVVLVLLAVIIFCFYRFLALGLTRIAFDFHDHDKSSLKQLFSCGHLVFTDACATLLYALMVGIGLMLLVLPGIYIAIVFGFYHQVIVDQQVGVFEALRKSNKITHGALLELFALGILLYAMRWAGLSFILVIFVVIPIITLIDVYVYRRLVATAQNGATQPINYRMD